MTLGRRIVLDTNIAAAKAHAAIDAAAEANRLHEAIVCPVARRDKRRNNAYWAKVQQISTFTGIPAYRCHYDFKRAFLGVEPTKAYGGTTWEPFSTKFLESREFDSFLYQVDSFSLAFLELPLLEDGSVIQR